MAYFGEIRRFPYAPPPGWMTCDGQLLQVSQHPILYALLGNTYGGESNKTFGLPDLRDRVAVDQGGTAGPMGANGMGGMSGMGM